MSSECSPFADSTVTPCWLQMPTMSLHVENVQAETGRKLVMVARWLFVLVSVIAWIVVVPILNVLAIRGAGRFERRARRRAR